MREIFRDLIAESRDAGACLFQLPVSDPSSQLCMLQTSVSAWRCEAFPYASPPSTFLGSGWRIGCLVSSRPQACRASSRSQTFNVSSSSAQNSRGMHTAPWPGRPMRRIIPIAIEIPHMHRLIANLPPRRRLGRVGDPERGCAVVGTVPEGAVARFGGEQRRTAGFAGAGRGRGGGGGGEGAALGRVGGPLADGGCAAEVGVFGVIEGELDGW
ncbi:uncharacterized protein BDZ99DRAFT_284420 [Mytilinidion resinicola]|uniref:Uncharacterized protein n=1 Tax=Mytilinidion resinicola TaxID=574789 RepID=A0A6A6YSP6_9PEZI|nr:uncharacterized protein BDZ99DRAFT_284420 [Mytilinidion resinicola]KAF2811966.1 hypothetical protein BDZ99DRAFT_284420 [Mytilinidion resinicola]